MTWLLDYYKVPTCLVVRTEIYPYTSHPRTLSLKHLTTPCNETRTLALSLHIFDSSPVVALSGLWGLINHFAASLRHP
jgi:hypothetical protein